MSNVSAGAGNIVVFTLCSEMESKGVEVVVAVCSMYDCHAGDWMSCHRSAINGSLQL